jgi:hypothetical protein
MLVNASSNHVITLCAMLLAFSQSHVNIATQNSIQVFNHSHNAFAIQSTHSLIAFRLFLNQSPNATNLSASQSKESPNRLSTTESIVSHAVVAISLIHSHAHFQSHENNFINTSID